MKKYIYGRTSFSNRPEYVFINLTEGFTVDVRLESYDLVITIKNATGTQIISDQIDCSLALRKNNFEDVERTLLDEVCSTLMNLVENRKSPAFTSMFAMIEDWEDVMMDNFYTEEEKRNNKACR